jgi:hypothetical protein
MGGETVPDGADDAAVAALAQLPNLEVLHLTARAITDAALAPFAKAVNLRELTLDRCPKVTEAALANLPVGLQRLSLRNLAAGDDAAKLLAERLPGLQALDLTAWQNLTDTGVLAVLAARELTSLRLLSCNKLTGALAGELLKETSLERLEVPGTVADAETAKALEAMPKMKAFRVSGRTTAAGAVILDRRGAR